MGRGAAPPRQLSGDEAAYQDGRLTHSATRIRRYRADDAEATARIYYDAVRLGTQAHYDAAQRRAWAPRVPDVAEWRDRLKPQTVFVAERGGAVAGFMTLTADGCIDLAFVAPEVMGQGIAGKLYDAILADARAAGIRRLYAEASHPARGFFERRGWTVARPQIVSRGGVSMMNFLMKMRLV